MHSHLLHYCRATEVTTLNSQQQQQQKKTNSEPLIQLLKSKFIYAPPLLGPELWVTSSSPCA